MVRRGFGYSGNAQVVAGRCEATGLPRAVEITSAEVCEALLPCVQQIATGLRRTLELAPPELASDIVDHGALLVWVVNPDARSVTVHREADDVRILTGDDELTAEDLLPGFRCGIGDLFAPPTP